MFYTAEPRDVIDGKITDVYFERTLAVLKAKKINPVVKAEFIVKSLPRNWPWAVLAGLEEAVEPLERLEVTVRAMPEGSLFLPYEPVLELEGRYQDFCVYETALLGFLCQASGICTQAARFKKLAGDRLVMSFGARRMHPILAPMIERYAFTGGCDGVSVVKSGEMLGEDPMGTMPHSLVLCMGSTLEALRAYDQVLAPSIRRVALIDTFQDEKFEVLNLAEQFGEKLFAVRFDTPASRRGNFYRILEEARWELDLRGHRHIRFFVSGGILEQDIPALNPLVHGYGIGTAISNAPVVDLAMDIVEIEGRPIAKRGKWSGSKRVLVCPACGKRMTVPNRPGPVPCTCGGTAEDLLEPLVRNGKRLAPALAPALLRRRVLEQVQRQELEE